MANPMQRRSKNAFLLGFLIAIIIMALVVGALVMRMRKITDEKNALIAKTKEVYVPSTDLDSDDVITGEVVRKESVQTSIEAAKIVDINTLPIEDENGEEISYKTKVAIPAGTIITTDMIYRDNEAVSNDERIQEYNMLELPSQLKNGDYIDIRFKISSGEDYIVLSKKRVEGTTADTIWIKVSEEEILTMNNAIVEAYTITGSKIYAVEYSDPGMQEKAEQNYPVSGEIYNLIMDNPNIVNEAKSKLRNGYTEAQQNQRTNRINPVVSQYIEERDTLVESGYSEEASKKQTLRQEYITQLESAGTGEVGYEAE